MEKIITENVFNAYSDEISKQKCKKTATFSVMVILLGVALMTATVTLIEDTSSTLYTLLTITAIIIALAGLFNFLFGGKKYVYMPTNSRIKEYSLYFQPEATEAIIPAIEQGDLSFLDRMDLNGNAPVKLEVLVSEDRKFANCQEFHYVPYTYEPVSRVARLSSSATECLLKYIEHHEKIKA